MSHEGNAQTVLTRKNEIKAMDAFIYLPPVGAKGLPKASGDAVLVAISSIQPGANSLQI